MRYLLVAALVLMTAVNASAYTKEAARAEMGAVPYGLSEDCLLVAYNWCAGWVWSFNDLQGAVWGVVLNPMDCPGGCANGGAVSGFYLYSRCQSGQPLPGTFNGWDIETVDAVGCPTGVLYQSGPVTVTHCVAGDRWTHFIVDPVIHVNGNPFAFTIEWGAIVGTRNHPQFSTHCGIGNIYCAKDSLAQFPGCASTVPTCPGYVNPPQNTFIYITDLNGDTVLDDICATYGIPYPLSFPYYNGYYVSNNLVVKVALDCTAPTAVEPTSWGHVKALYE